MRFVLFARGVRMVMNFSFFITVFPLFKIF